MNNTKENILDVAERLFAENGFAGTSIRAIVDEANVNIAAINYHFKSKEGLFVSVIKRRFSEIETQRFTKLDAHLKLTNSKATLEGVVRAFLEPLKTAFKTNNLVPMMLIRVFCESEELRELIKPVFNETRSRFFSALKHVYPNMNDSEVQWRFQFMISAMVGMIIFSKDMLTECNSMDESVMIEKLIHQTMAGIK